MPPEHNRLLFDNISYLFRSLDPSEPEYYDRERPSRMRPSEKIQNFLHTAKALGDDELLSSADMCELFCTCCRIRDETTRGQQGLQSAYDTIALSMAHIEEIKVYLQKRYQELQVKELAAGGLIAALDQMVNASERELQIVLGKVERFTIVFEKMASQYAFLYQTFTEEIYNLFLKTYKHFELDSVKMGLDSLDLRLQGLYNSASHDQIYATRKEKECRNRLRLVRIQLAAEAQRTTVSISTENTADDALAAIPEHEHELELDREHDAGPVAELRAQLEEVLGANMPALSVTVATQHVPEGHQTPVQAARIAPEEDDGTSTGVTPSTQEVSWPLREGSPLLPDGSVSFSAVEEQIHGRSRGVRGDYITSARYDGPPQLGSSVLLNRINRNGRTVPRIFTGSFSELELGMERLRASTTSNSTPIEVPRTAATEPIMIRDFATPSATSAATPIAASVPASPTPQTQQRHAVLSGEALTNNRNGGISRGPPGRFQLQSLRSRTVGDRSRSTSSQRLSRRQNTL